MFGKNPKRAAIKNNGDILEIQEIFATIQGEGPYSGWPAIFIRLGGCNLACSFCDTEFESFQKMKLSAIVQQTQLLNKKQNIQLVVITGGEPFRQTIGALCTSLLENGFMVQIETNGTLYQEIDERVDVVCSPKNVSGKYSAIRPDLLERISAFKFIISHHNQHYSSVEEVGQSQYNVPVYVQAMDEYDAIKNKANLNLAVNLALEHGYRLSLQIHKLIGVN